MTLDQAELCANRANGEYDAAVADELYAIASAAIGVPTACGLAPIDTALVSLADLTDYLKTRKTWDANAVAVHLRAFRLLLHTEAGKDSNGTKAILEGLRRVSQRYAKTAADAPSAAAGRPFTPAPAAASLRAWLKTISANAPAAPWSAPDRTMSEILLPNTVWYGRVLGFRYRIDEAIAVFSEGLGRFPTRSNSCVSAVTAISRPGGSPKASPT
uniref:Uncharacterized protein n=1 Tax=Phenylobacterium glaciei TaxID=2803784 RepID=A0A974S8N9_9CAUL|nr:hypothetical protein JKL49_25670 [Phenylobacterium glaciei]